MSATTTSPFNKADSTPQSIQRLLDENAQLIKALVENMSNKGKSMECIQYQQTLHRNLVFLAGLADPNLNIQALIPNPNSIPNTTTQQPQSTNSPQVPYQTGDRSSPSSTPAGPASSGTGQPPMRQPQATMNPSTSSDTNWMASSQNPRGTPPSTMSAGQYPPSGSMRNFEGGMWNNQSQQQGMYSIQQGSGFGSMMSTEDRQRQQQILRMRQEQLIQAQQIRRMQMQQQQSGSSVPGGGAMYPAGPMGPSSGMMGPGGIPPGYPQTSMMQMPPGPMNMH